MAGRCCAIKAQKLYLFHDCLQIHADILDEMDDADPMQPEIRGDAHILPAAEIIFLMLDFGSDPTNGTENGGKSYSIRFCLI